MGQRYYRYFPETLCTVTGPHVGHSGVFPLNQHSFWLLMGNLLPELGATTNCKSTVPKYERFAPSFYLILDAIKWVLLSVPLLKSQGKITFLFSWFSLCSLNGRNTPRLEKNLQGFSSLDCKILDSWRKWFYSPLGGIKQ